jgi:IS30 family transposase
MPDDLRRESIIIHDQEFSITEIGRDLNVHPSTAARKLDSIERTFRESSSRL